MQDVHPKGADPPPKSVIKPFTYEETLVAFRWLDRLAEGPVPQSGTIPYVMATNLWARGEIAPHTVIRRDDKGVVIERIPHWRLHDMNITCCQRPNGHPPGARIPQTSFTEAIFPRNASRIPLPGLRRIRRIRHPKVAEHTLPQLRWNIRDLTVHENSMTGKVGLHQVSPKLRESRWRHLFGREWCAI